MIKYLFDTEPYTSARDPNGPDERIDVLMSFRTSSFPTVHTHGYWEIVVMKKNSIVNVLNSEEHIMNDKDACLIRPENEHCLTIHNSNDVEFYNLLVRTGFFLSIIKQISPSLLSDGSLNSPHYITLEPHTHAEIIHLLDKAISLSFKNIVEMQKLLRLAVIKLVTTLFTPTNEIPISNDLVTQIINVMSVPENMQLSLGEIAEKTGYCQEHIIRTFRKNGLNKPNTVFMSIKVEYAKTLLCSSDFSTADIADRIGISNESYFNKLFKQFYGITPSMYRKNNTIR